jgi:hypothetical protein
VGGVGSPPSSDFGARNRPARPGKQSIQLSLPQTSSTFIVNMRASLLIVAVLIASLSVSCLAHGRIGKTAKPKPATPRRTTGEYSLIPCEGHQGSMIDGLNLQSSATCLGAGGPAWILSHAEAMSDTPSNPTLTMTSCHGSP